MRYVKARMRHNPTREAFALQFNKAIEDIRPVTGASHYFLECIARRALLGVIV